MSRPRATPKVRATAERLGIDLRTVLGTGAGSRVTVDDVFRASLRADASQGSPVATAGVHGRPSLTRAMPSAWASGKTLQLDVFALNPLVDDLRQSDPKAYELGTRYAPPPTMFVGGHVPVFTAAGFDPARLLQLPWVVRHAAAAADQELVAKIFDKCGSGDEGAFLAAGPLGLGSPGLSDYQARVRAWKSPNPSAN